MGRSNTTGQLLDKYRAEVISTDHPQGWHKAKIRVLVLWDDIPVNDLPWAEYQLPLGARPGEGDAMPCQVGDLVWVEFPMSGDSRAPLITGSCYRVSEEKSELPQELFKALYEHKRADGEPPAPVTTYGDKVLDLFGVLHQITMNGAWCLTHKPTGTAMNITKDGDLILHTEANSYSSTTGNHIEQVAKDLVSNIGGQLNITVKGNALIKSEGDIALDAGGGVAVKASSNVAIEAGGELTLKGSKISGKTGSIYDFK